MAREVAEISAAAVQSIMNDMTTTRPMRYALEKMNSTEQSEMKNRFRAAIEREILRG